MNNKPNRLSHSAVSKYIECPRKYDLHYNKRIRPTKMGSALFFGSAVDQGLQSVCNGSNNGEVDFLKAWQSQEINSISQGLCGNINVLYSNGDIDLELLSDDDKKTLVTTFSEDWEYLFQIIFKTKKEERLVDSLPLFNTVAWFCLRKKGLLFLKKVTDTVLPDLKVLAIQVPITLNNGEDSVTGAADLVARYKDIEKPIILDFKTTSVPYENESVLESPQLSLYVHALSEFYEDTRLAGYITLNKRIVKDRTKICKKCGADGSKTKHRTCNVSVTGARCDGEFNVTTKFDVKVQIIIDQIPERTETQTLDNFDTINTAIHKNEFPMNTKSCMSIYGPCPYFSLCHQDEMTDLVQLPEKNEGRK